MRSASIYRQRQEPEHECGAGLDISFRLIRSLLGVAEFKNITHAARELNHSQASITKQIQLLEQKLGVPLFDRTTKGMTLTAYCEALLPRAEACANAFKQIRALLQKSPAHHSSGASHFYHMDISDRWLAAFLATVEHHNVQHAALSLGISPAAVMSSLKKLERSFGMRLFMRTANRLAPTDFAISLAQYVKLAMSELAHARDELSSMRGAERGHVRVGTLPYARALIVPRAINRLLAHNAYIDVSTMEASHDALTAALRCGDIDMIVGALRGRAECDLVEKLLLNDHLSIIARAGHPLFQVASPTWEDLSRYGWIFTTPGTPTRALVEQAMLANGFKRPPHIIETSCPITLRGLLVESDRLTVASAHQIHYEIQLGLLKPLPFVLENTERSIGITIRGRSTLSRAAESLIEQLQHVAEEIESCRD